MKKYFVFRVNYDDAHSWIMDELFKKGTLRQGWGKTNFQLIEKDGTFTNKEIWKARYKAVWDDSDHDINKRYDILSRMLGINDGDMLVIPKSLDGNTLTICEAAGKYAFDDINDTIWDDFKHTIPVKNPKNYRYSSSVEAKLISSKFKAYQSAVNNIWQARTIDAIEELYKKKPSDLSKTTRQLTDEMIQLAIQPIANKLLDVDPNKFEDIIAECLKSRGYDIISTRQYDREGADVDITASYSLPYFTEVTDLAPTLLIQIKKKRGTDWNDIEGVDQLIKAGNDQIYPIKILINTTDKISPEAEQKAAAHGITIINGSRVIDLILKSQFS